MEPLDKLLLAVLLPIWVVCFGLGLRSLTHPMLVPPISVRATEADGYPILIDITPWGDSETGLQRGDRLIRLGDTDLRGVDPLGFYARFVAQARYGHPLPKVTYEREGERGETHLPTPISSQPPSVQQMGQS
jgi:hypothetical protein